MENIRSIYAHDPGIRLHELRVRRVRLNRHLPEAQWIAEHKHSFAQILLYLGGSGWQQIAGQSYSIEKGSLFFIPPGVQHSFVEPVGKKPLCLALDFNYKAGNSRGVTVRRLNSVDLNRVRHALSGLTRWHTGHEHIEPGEAAEVLRLIDIFFRAMDFLRSLPTQPEQHTIYRAVQRALHQPAAFRQTLAELAEIIGYHPDYLNRVLKGVCGLTLGALRNEVRMQKSKHMLAEAKSIAAAAEGAGFDDPNYFARWFREQTGLTPSSWRVGNQRSTKRITAEK